MKRKVMAENSLIFIPDISGFTKFVNETELSHSQHIIQELLEVILDANKIDLSVSEIEGDAVLFYKIGNIPSLEDLADQIKSMFIKFHEQLHLIERDRVCHCGACSNAINLTLKFLTHSGEIIESQIKDHKKLMGKDVILAHRLLKNNIKSNEYSLITENFLNDYEENNFQNHFNWAEMQSGKMNYEHIGDVNFKFVNLTALKDQIKKPTRKSGIQKFRNPILVESFINAPKEFIYNTIIDLSLRPKWTDGLMNIEYNKNEIPKIGSSHKCEFDQGSFDIETVYSNKNKAYLEIAERINNNILFPQATSFIILADNQRGTDIKMEIHYKRIPIIGILIDLLFRSKLEENITSSIANLKEFCESNYQIKKQMQ